MFGNSARKSSSNLRLSPDGISGIYGNFISALMMMDADCPSIEERRGARDRFAAHLVQQGSPLAVQKPPLPAPVYRPDAPIVTHSNYNVTICGYCAYIRQLADVLQCKLQDICRAIFLPPGSRSLAGPRQPTKDPVIHHDGAGIP
jgi:hypothetical protein